MRLSAKQKHRVEIVLNGQPVSAEAEPRLLLSDFLRQDLGAFGTHVGCEHGVCGACTVRIDGAPARACLTLAVQAHGCRIDTVEGLSPRDGRLSVLQAAFQRHHALQCGFCTAGILMSMDHLLATDPAPDEPRVREVLSGHLCRCTGYHPIITAVLDAAAHIRAEANDA
jgi:2-furoyl-CoA dehydrogenase 2Fe-2S iron sulfur subunit